MLKGPPHAHFFTFFSLYIPHSSFSLSIFSSFSVGTSYGVSVGVCGAKNVHMGVQGFKVESQGQLVLS